jgi:Glycosyl transferase family 21
MKRCTYLLPIRRINFDGTEAEQLRGYLAVIQAVGCEAIVIDGSAEKVFARHHESWSNVCRHEPVDRRFGYLNDKVNGVHTGVVRASNEKIILADDDIRYSPADIEQTCALLDQFEVVRPQNYYSSASGSPPWWAKMEAARMLINRATLRNADYPGTCAFRKTTMARAGEYDGDVLFDNEEIIRHFARSGARMCYANDFFIEKRPPDLRKWLEQRPRQAYEDFGLRFKTILFAAFLPIAVGIALIAGIEWLGIFGFSILVAFGGWLRGSARKYFPLHTCLFAPLWIAERTLSTYWAFYWFLTRGGYPFGDRILRKGTGRDWVEGARHGAKMPASYPPNV